MEIPYEVTPRRDTGLYNAKVGIWLFLASEVMLFGGLFSAYVFLRVGVNDGLDTPWPMGLNVHGNLVWLGFLNTIVLILSSVFVVFAWLALKERKWNVFRNWMIAVIGCAAIFMAVKSYEYNNKLNHHFGIKLKDGSVVEGEIAHGNGDWWSGETDKIAFSGKKVTMGLLGDLPAFVGHIEGDFPSFTIVGDEEQPAATDDAEPAAEGGDSEAEAKKETLDSEAKFKKWFYEQRRNAKKELAESRKNFRAAKRAGKPEALEPVATSVELIAEKPFKILAKDRKVPNYTDTLLTYIDNVSIEGELVNDKVKLIAHQIDLQLVPIAKQDEAQVWPFFEGYPEVRPTWEKKRDEAVKEIRSHFEGKPIPGKVVQGAYIMLHNLHGGDLKHKSHDEDHSDTAKENHSQDEGHKDDHAEENHGEGEHDEAGHASDEHAEHHTTITVPRSEIRFMGNHGPRYGNYYAIYFTMTALHGLHVIGGALVLLYFVLFGKKLYLKNPEHLANRVEVGGLFWHFVDLVWIFLFPIMYLF